MRWTPGLLPILLAGSSACSVAPKSKDLMQVSIISRGSEECLAAIDGKTFDPRDAAAVETALNHDANSNQDVHIIGAQDVPYRCLGALIYTLQKHGHGKVGFISEPPSEDTLHSLPQQQQ